MATVSSPCLLCGKVLKTDNPVSIKAHQDSEACKKAAAAQQTAAKQQRITDVGGGGSGAASTRGQPQLAYVCGFSLPRG